MEGFRIWFCGYQSRETPFTVLLKECCLKYFWVLCSVRFSGRGVYDTKSLISIDILISKVGVLNFSKLRGNEGEIVIHKKNGENSFSEAVEARVLNDLRLAFKIDEIREAIFGQQSYDVVLLETRANYEGETDVERGTEINHVYWSDSMRTCWRSVEDRKKFVLMMAREEIINDDMDIASGLLKACGVVGHTGGKDKRKTTTRSFDCKLREEAEIEEVLKKLQKLSKLVRTNVADSHSGAEDKYGFDFCCAKADEADLVGNLTSVIGVGDEEDTATELIEWPRLKGTRVEYPTGSSRFREFCKAKSSIDGIWGHAFGYREVILVCETLNGRWAASGSESRITAKDFLEYYDVKYVTTTDGAYLFSSSSRPCFFDLSSAGRMWNDNFLWVSGECLQQSYEESLELNNRTITNVIIYRRRCQGRQRARSSSQRVKISRFKRVASKDDKVRRSQTKRRLAGKTPGLMEEKLSTPELNTPLKLARLNEILDGPVDMGTVSSIVVRNLAKWKAVKRGAAPRFVVSVSVDDSSKRRKVDGAGKDDLPAQGGEKLVGREPDSGEGSFPVGAGERKGSFCPKVKEVRAESEAEAKRLVTTSTISRNNLAGKLYHLRYTKAEIMAFSEGNYEEMEIMDEEEVEEREDGLAENTATDNQKTINQKELDVVRERKEQTLLYNAEYAKEYEVLFSQYEDRLDDNVKLSLKLEESKRQVKEKTATILSRDLALNQLTSELAELKEKAASGSRHEAELAEYRIRALNEEISDMKCNIRALNEQLLKRVIELDTARTNLAVFEADFEKLSRRETQSRADLAEIQAKNKSLVDDLAHARRNVRRVVQREKEMNERINQLCARISESERELRVREMKYQKELKFELDKRDGEIFSGEGSREMKEFLRRKEELVENMRIDLTNSRQKSIDLTRQMSERIDQLTAELAESKTRRLKNNKRAAVTHQIFKELVVHEQEKYNGDVLHQWQLSALVAFFVEEIKFLQVESGVMQDCFSGRTCVCKLDISSIDPIGVMDRGIGTTTAEEIARGREIVAERAQEYMASRTEIGGSSSVVSPTPIVGGRSTALPSRKSSIVKKKQNSDDEYLLYVADVDALVLDVGP
ncbi:hypothetical protein GIB67_007967 [Kingdonia uniflora]|uniref:Uncharacterized protein n=1 Tax=Kingdonia uniflora TaxID=39325 RepID=A0A7J7LTR6_9MAGN|nr:hypothetical protein GIB67_007967 [Kingdonia uniflora]